MKLKILSCCLFLLLLSAAPAYCGQYRVTGVVVAASGGKPLAGVAVSAKGAGVSTRTNAKGRFTLVFQSDDNETVQFRLSGYRSVSKTIDSSTSAVIVSMQKDG